MIDRYPCLMDVQRPNSDKLAIEEKPYRVGGFFLLLCLAFLTGSLQSLWTEDYATLLMASVYLAICGTLDWRSFPLDELQEIIVQADENLHRLALRFQMEPEPTPLTKAEVRDELIKGGNVGFLCAAF